MNRLYTEYFPSITVKKRRKTVVCLIFKKFKKYATKLWTTKEGAKKRKKKHDTLRTRYTWRKKLKKLQNHSLNKDTINTTVVCLCESNNNPYRPAPTVVYSGSMTPCMKHTKRPAGVTDACRVYHTTAVCPFLSMSRTTLLSDWVDREHTRGRTWMGTSTTVWAKRGIRGERWGGLV